MRVYLEIIRKRTGRRQALGPAAQRDRDIVECAYGEDFELNGNSDQTAVYQAGFPSLKRSVSVSPPLTTSRARVRSAPSCLTFDPVTSTASSALNATPISSRNFLGQRKTSTESGPLLTTR